MSGNLKSPDIRELKPRIAVVGVGGAAGRRIRAGTLAPTPGKELEPASLSCAARTELNTVAERTNIFAGLPFGLVKNDQTGFPPTVAHPRSGITNAKYRLIRELRRVCD
jgi:hypothetical protein